MSPAKSAGPEPSRKVAGSESVKAALIQATGDLLGELGPKAVSVRDIAHKAGVNHGQIHHYFGGKRGLLKAAIRELARDHYAHSLELSGGDAMPPPLSLGEDRTYFRALCHSVMDGDIDLVMAVEGDDELSVPRRVMRELREGQSENDLLDTKARLASIAAMQLGWVAFEDLLLINSDVRPDEQEAFKERVKRLMQGIIDQAK